MKIQFMQQLITRIEDDAIKLLEGSITEYSINLEDSIYDLKVSHSNEPKLKFLLSIVLDENQSEPGKVIGEYHLKHYGDLVNKINNVCDEIIYPGREIEELAKVFKKHLKCLPGFDIEPRGERFITLVVLGKTFLVQLHTNYILKTSYKVTCWNEVSNYATAEEMILGILASI